MPETMDIKPQNALSGNRQKEKYLFVFVVSFVVFMVVLVPILIVSKGYMFYYGDFNAQQNMFYDHVQRAVKSGSLNWDWGTDLGSSFIGSYAFYLLGSPFFWITVLFPEGAAPYLIPWLLGLKTSVAAVTSYAYIRRFVKTPDSAAIGAFLYAFSGFQLYDLFFNHFHDVTAFFPLLLLALEMAVVDNKKGVFALTVALSAVVNYFFFVGHVVFLVIYFICRCLSKDFTINIKKFGILALESVVGVMLSAFMLVPAVLAITGNPRMESSINGINMVVYNESVRILRIIQSFFMMSDPPARSNLFASEYGRWSSIAGYLPMFSMAGVIAFMRGVKKHWAKRVIAVCIVFAFVPFLNTAFYLFTSAYYRWFYMPVLIMALMTSLVLESAKENEEGLSFKKGIPAVCVVLGIFIVISLLPSKVTDETTTGEVAEKIKFAQVAQYPGLFILQMAVTVLTLLLLILFVYKLSKNKKNYYRIITVFTVISITVYSASNIWYGALQGPEPQKYIDQAINGADQLRLEQTDGEFYRIDTSPNIDNYCMFWGYSSMRAFHSVVTTSIMEFYIDMGLSRDVASRIDTKYTSLRGLLSVKYYVYQKHGDENEEKKGSPVFGFTKLKETKDFIVYENENYIPMGFAYDTYITEEQFKELSTANKAVVLLDSLVLTPEQYLKYSDIIEKGDGKVNTSTPFYKNLCEERREQSCKSFYADKDGFTAEIDLDSDKLVFFSVPYDKGFTATVNGVETEIEKVSNGMMAVRVPAGENNVIRFDFETYGFRQGVIISVCGGIILAVYLGINACLKRKKTAVNVKSESENNEEEE